MHRDDVPIAAPCGIPWNDMEQAGGTYRFCRTCARPVVDLSAMTERQARRWIARQEGACVSYLVDDEGTIAFRPQPERPLHLAATAGILATMVAGCEPTTAASASATKDAAASAEQNAIAVRPAS